MSGKVLAGLARRIAPEVAATSVGAPEEVRALAAELAQIEEGTVFSLEGKRALVTGASGGIGGAIAARCTARARR